MRKVNKDNRLIPSYIQLKQILVAEIEKSDQDFKLPSIRNLMKFHKVSQSTVEKAIVELEKEGFIRDKNSSGIYAQSPTPDSTEIAPPTNHLASHNKGIVGIQVFDLVNFSPRIISGVKKALTTAGYFPLVYCPDYGTEASQVETFIDILIQNDAKGVISIPNQRVKEQHARLKENHIPLVYTVDSTEDNKVDCIVNDDTLGGQLATEHLISKGHKNILCVMGDNPSGHRRLAGFKNTMSAAGLSTDNHLLLKNGSNRLDIQLIHKQIVSTKATAIFAFNDVWALEIYWALNGKGVKIPEDIALIGYDDSEIIKVSHVPLTSIAQPCLEMGMQAARTLIDRMEQITPQPPELIKLPPQLVIRETV